VSDVKPNALAVREAVEATHPEIRITIPLVSKSGLWELEIGDSDRTSYSDFWMMVDYLVGLFGDIKAISSR
jgi:hypothetical protein